MDEHFYQQEFQKAVDAISEKDFDDAGLQLSVNIILESVALKIYKPEWASNVQSPLNAPGRIFFSVWVSEKSIGEGKLYYNIHALKVRALKAYKIPARSFAEEFRTRFEKEKENWENVSVKYGPLTLMEGWVVLKHDQLQDDLLKLAHQFMTISPLIDELLNKYRLKP
ncbi:hypothetical protein B0A69_03410 [Chryseobacterium shigense]|uniref:DUF4268 domain-containing protein n=1 Tax=Chryseobacterium shigense TaxID=297244 RepID=A0A1N7I7D0_9FLAO|nr:hypothetical protein [Chryseobacterium shigense]PQA97105.1 hypothetical protein B0A69_03410 [Chryseobacterium shigense]SIS32987.1 hypothetical protein SAMN05421639_102449 [Chryseobacterium shigense]